MNFNIGDRVKFLDDVGKGTVIGLIDKEMVLVRTDDGFEYPVIKKELLITDKEEKVVQSTVTHAKQQVKASAPVPELTFNQADTETEEGQLSILFGIQPLSVQLKQNPKYSLFIVNNSLFRVFYHAGKGSDRKVATIKAGYIEPGKSVRLGNCSQPFLTEKESFFFFQIIAYRNSVFTRHEPISAKIKLTEEELNDAANYRKNSFFSVNTYLVPVEQSVNRKVKMSLDDFRSAMKTEKPGEIQHRKEAAVQKKEPGKVNFQEIDLHIEEITDKSKGLTPGEIIDIQLARFKTVLEGAVLAGEKKIVFIHGLGAGKLKNEIRKIIDKEYPSCMYQDASFKEYGYGATLILIGNSNRSR